MVGVQTTPACVPDVVMTPSSQQAMDEREPVPSDQLVDSGYADAELLVSSQEQYGITLIGPPWQITGGKPKRARDLMARTFRLIGSTTR